MVTKKSLNAWHTLSVETVFERLGIRSEKGLSHTEIQNRLAEYGPNELVEHGVKSPGLFCWISSKRRWCWCWSSQRSSRPF